MSERDQRLSTGGGDAARALATELTRLRKLAGLSGRELGGRIEISQSKVSRIEAGALVPPLPDVRSWARVVSASESDTELLLALTEEAHRDLVSWRTAMSSRRHLQRDVGLLETDARQIFTFQPSLVPGLLQTVDYARKQFEMFQEPAYDRDRLAEAVAARLERQTLLHDTSKTFHFLITEGALRWRPGTRSHLAAQWDRISNLSEMENVHVRVLPFSIRAEVQHTHAFTLYEWTDGHRDDIVDVELIHGAVRITEPSDVDAYRRRWDTLGKSAVEGTRAQTFLRNLIRELRKHPD